MNILITGVGNKTNLLKYFRRALFNEGGGKLLACDVNPLVNARFFVDIFFSCPRSDEPSYLDCILEQVKEHQISLIIPSRDEDVGYLITLKERLAQEFDCYLMAPHPDVFAICRHKGMFTQWCRQHQFQTPQEFLPEQVKAADLPVFVKPSVGSGSRGALKVDTWENWLSLQQDIDSRFLVQDFISAPEYSVDIFLNRQNKVLSVVPRIRHLVSAGESIHGKVDLHPLIIASCTRLAETLQLEGHNTIQCFLLQDKVIFNEVNPRYGGGFTLGVEAGADTPRMLIQSLRKELAPVAFSSLKNGLEMLRIQKDIFFNLSEPKVFCFDLDGTICTESCTYENAQVMPFVAAKIRTLYQAGHTIIIATARGASSQTNWRPLIEQQLSAWNIPYHRLLTDKPFADVYIDNKALDVLEFI